MKTRPNWNSGGLVATSALALLLLAGCGSGGGSNTASGGEELGGTITIDGSSTVFPISEAVAEEFPKTVGGKVKVTVGQSGTSGGMKKFVVGEIDIADASRPISKDEEEKAAANGIEFIEIPVAFDGLSVVVNPQNDWVDHLTVAELKKIWEPNSTVKTWADVRAGFPPEPIKLYGPGTDSGTFDYFTKAIVGKEKSSRADYQPSEDDNTLVTGVQGDKGSLGYFGFAYYVMNKDKLKVVPIDNGAGPVAPSDESIANGSYQPLSRPEFIYVSKKAWARPEVKAFVKFYLNEGRALVHEVGYVALPDKAYELAWARFEKGTVGSVFAGGSQIGVRIEDILAKEAG